MKFKIHFLLLFLSVFFTTQANAAFTTIDLNSVANTTYAASGMINGAHYPTGDLIFDDKPFFINPAGNHVWHSQHVSSYGTVFVDIPVNVFGAVNVYTLINTFWGEKSAGTYAAIEFFGSDDGYYKVDLDGQVHIRDYNYNPSYTTNIDPNWTKQVWSYSNQQIDMQTFLLPGTFSDETLVQIRLTDSGSINFQRTFIGGVTVSSAAVPVPSAFVLLATGIIGLAGMGRHSR